MSKCNEYWCEHYGENSGKCEQCKGQREAKDSPELRVMMTRRKIEQMDAIGQQRNSRGQER